MGGAPTVAPREVASFLFEESENWCFRNTDSEDVQTDCSTEHLIKALA